MAQSCLEALGQAARSRSSVAVRDWSGQWPSGKTVSIRELLHKPGPHLIDVGENRVEELGFTSTSIPLNPALAVQLTSFGRTSQLLELGSILLLDGGSLTEQLRERVDMGLRRVLSALEA